MPRTTVQLDIVSDVMCPWCYIGKRRLETAMTMLTDIDLDIRWRPFQLDPTIPPEGMDRQEYLDRKFGREGGREAYARIADAGRSEGIPFDFAAIAVSPNTLNAHRLIRWAATAGCQDAVVEHLFRLYFTEGGNVGDREVLVGVAEAAGMDAKLVRELLATDRDVELVRREIALAQAMGVHGVPGFIFDNAYLVSGAQPPELLAEVAEKAAETRAERAERPPVWA